MTFCKAGLPRELQARSRGAAFCLLFLCIHLGSHLPRLCKENVLSQEKCFCTDMIITDSFQKAPFNSPL